MKKKLVFAVITILTLSVYLLPNLGNCQQSQDEETTKREKIGFRVGKSFESSSEKIEDPITKAKSGDVKAQLELGKRYVQGKKVPQDYEKAVKWFRQAAQQGNAEAQYGLAMMYGLGLGVSVNEEKTIKWMKKAAEQGFPVAQIYLGKLYEEGDGVKKNHKTAVKWFRKAAEQHYPLGQILLSKLYFDGNGVIQDYVEAYKLVNVGLSKYNINEDRDDDFLFNSIIKKGYSLRKKIRNEMAGEQLAEAQKLSREWIKEHRD